LQLPVFNDGILTTKIVFRKAINYSENQNLFERFSKHIFENAFDYTMFEFNIQSSSFKLLPCLLTSMDIFLFDERLNKLFKNKIVERPK
jgi:hypothetical protein